MTSRWADGWAIITLHLTTVQNRKANGYTVSVSSFVWPLDYFLKWAHQKAMLGNNKGHNMMRCCQRNIVLSATDDGNISMVEMINWKLVFAEGTIYVLHGTKMQCKLFNKYLFNIFIYIFLSLCVTNINCMSTAFSAQCTVVEKVIKSQLSGKWISNCV